MSLKKPSKADFQTINKLGEGSFGIVHKVRRLADQKIYVMKEINISGMSPRVRDEAINEVYILNKLQSPFIVKYFESFIEKNTLHIIMEYCEGGDLANYLRQQMGKFVTEEKIWKIFIQILLGLNHLHEQKILHRDIKTMNIFLKKEEVIRIGDLGVAKTLSSSKNFANTLVGTPYYLSPEMCEEKPYNEKSDIWALGCVLYEICTKKHPFEANNQGALFIRIIRGKYDPVPSIYSKELIEIVQKCLMKNLKNRPNSSDLLNSSIISSKAASFNFLSSNNDDIPEKDIFKHLEIKTPTPITQKSKEKKDISDKKSDNGYLDKIIPEPKNQKKANIKKEIPQNPSNKVLKQKLISQKEEKVIDRNIKRPKLPPKPSKEEIKNEPASKKVEISGSNNEPKRKGKRVEMLMKKIDQQNSKSIKSEKNAKFPSSSNERSRDIETVLSLPENVKEKSSKSVNNISMNSTDKQIVLTNQNIDEIFGDNEEEGKETQSQYNDIFKPLKKIKPANIKYFESQKEKKIPSQKNNDSEEEIEGNEDVNSSKDNEIQRIMKRKNELEKIRELKEEMAIGSFGQKNYSYIIGNMRSQINKVFLVLNQNEDSDVDMVAEFEKELGVTIDFEVYNG